MTAPYAEVIGDPIIQSKSPLIHTFWLEKLGIDAEYRACHVRPTELEDYFTRRRRDAAWRGCNVTIPHKETVLALVDQSDASASEIGASNCIVSRDAALLAFNTDTAGVAAALPAVASSLCLIGVGGAARAALSQRDRYCIADVRIIARDRDKALRLASEFDFVAKIYGFEDPSGAFAGVEGVINASPLGMVGQPSMPQSILESLALSQVEAYVFDMVYNPLETALLRQARTLNRTAIDGLVMLIGQAKGAFKHFFGYAPPDSLDAELRELLTR